jgi:hypothetical protein
MLELNDTVFHCPYLVANAPEVLFQRIKECAKMALLGNNPYTDRQLVTNAICLLLITGLYTRPFEDWDRLIRLSHTWIALCTMIQEAFQHCLNATAPTAGHHGYAQAQPFCQNTFAALEADDTEEESVDGSVTTQVAALTYQSQLTANTGANTSVRLEQQLVHLMAQQQMMHKDMHQLIVGLNAVMFNQSDEGRGVGRFAARGYSGGYSRHARSRRGHSYHGRGPGPSVFGYSPAGGFPPIVEGPPGFLQSVPSPGGLQAYHPPPGGSFHPTTLGGQHAPPYSNKVKRFSNWNVCYSCDFDVADGHISMTCPLHMCKPGHDVHFSHQNSQQ